MVILKPSRTKTRGPTRASSVATGLSVCREPLDEFDFSLCAREMRHRRDSSDDVARHQADDEPVGVAENDRVIDRQVER